MQGRLTVYGIEGGNEECRKRVVIFILYHFMLPLSEDMGILQ